MEEKKIVLKIDDDGSLNAETFGMSGSECLDEIDRLMKDIALSGTCKKKSEFYEQKTTSQQTVKNKHD